MKRWLIFLMSLTLTVAVAGGVVAGFTVGDDGSNPPTEDTTGPTNTSEGGPADGWHFVQATGWSGGFSLWLPPPAGS